MNPFFLADFYKTDHRRQYPNGTQLVYSNMTPRGSRMPNVEEVVVFGMKYFIKKYLQESFNKDFFEKKKSEVIDEYKREMDIALGKDSIPVDHLEDLHDLGYLPILIKALPEGTRVPIRVPFCTIQNTDPSFYWLTNALETLMSNVLWHPMTVATIAYEYRKLLNKYALETSDNLEFVEFQGHDFSMRGQTSVESSSVSCMGHLLSFKGTDTIPAIINLRKYYNARGFVGGSVPATEHSVMCFGGKETELETYRRLIKEVYPNGIVSIVSDTWDYWKVLTDTLPTLKDEILNRDGKVVIRPDSGDPVKIICGDLDAPANSPERLGTASLLYETFGGTKNSKGYIDINPKIGMIYGDSITLERAEAICQRLKEKGFSSTNIVFGIGSFTYQYVTRDTFSFAIKATGGRINGVNVHVSKDPKTDPGMKKSARGFLKVVNVNNRPTLIDGLELPLYTHDDDLLEPVFRNWPVFNDDRNGIDTFSQIRRRLHGKEK